jgi:hypothetical protein
MGRPLNTRVAALLPGHVVGERPRGEGLRPSLPGSFASEADARAWLAGAVRAHQQGRALPGPERARSTGRVPRSPAHRPPQAPEARDDITSVAEARTVAVYEDLRRGGPERAERVRRLIEGYIVPWFAPRRGAGRGARGGASASARPGASAGRPARSRSHSWAMAWGSSRPRPSRYGARLHPKSSTQRSWPCCRERVMRAQGTPLRPT